MTDTTLTAVAKAATPTEMGGTPDLFAPACDEHGRGCDDPWDCHEQRVTTAIAARIQANTENFTELDSVLSDLTTWAEKSIADDDDADEIAGLYAKVATLARRLRDA